MVDLRAVSVVKIVAVVFLLCGSFVWAGETAISRVPDPSGSFCHIRFPAISEETLFSDQPTLKDATDGDIIDAYGPCSFDPLGIESVLRQRRDHQIRMRREYGRD